MTISSPFKGLAVGQKQHENASHYSRVFYGDTNLCEQWITYAQNILQQMLLRPGTQSRRVMATPDVEVYVTSRPNRIEIKAGGDIYVSYSDNDNVSNSYIFKTNGKHSKTIPSITSNYHVPGIVDSWGSATITSGNKKYWYNKKNKTCISWDFNNVYEDGKTISVPFFDKIITCSKVKNSYIIVSLVEDNPSILSSPGTYILNILNKSGNSLVLSDSYDLPYEKYLATYWGFLTDGKSLLVTNHVLLSGSQYTQKLYKFILADDLLSWTSDVIFTSTPLILSTPSPEVSVLVQSSEYIQNIFINEDVASIIIVYHHIYWTTPGDGERAAHIKLYSLINDTINDTGEAVEFHVYGATAPISNLQYFEGFIHFASINSLGEVELLVKETTNNDIIIPSYIKTIELKSPTLGSITLLSTGNPPFNFNPDPLVTPNTYYNRLLHQSTYDGYVLICTGGNLTDAVGDDNYTLILDTYKNEYDFYNYRIDNVSNSTLKYLSVTTK